VVRTIADQHSRVDVVHFSNSAYHFDDCVFLGSTGNINSHYDELLRVLDPANPDYGYGARVFGTLLHPVQDFYAHSNWVEPGNTTRIVDEGTGEWTVMQPFTVVNGVMIVQGERVPAGMTVTRNRAAPYSQNAVVTVETSDGTRWPGLISGYVFLTDDCPDHVAMSHGALNKDASKGADRKTTFPDAARLAIAQTTHEWCRPATMVQQTYGQTGLSLLAQNWVADKAAARAACEA
jgi:hypothetical protein